MMINKLSKNFSTGSRFDSTKKRYSKTSDHLLLLNDDVVDNDDLRSIYESYENSRFDTTCDPSDEILLENDRFNNHRSVYSQIVKNRG